MKNLLEINMRPPCDVIAPEKFKHAEPESDDCGLPESPIYSNYVKYMWKAHTRLGGVQSLEGSRQNKRKAKSTKPQFEKI